MGGLDGLETSSIGNRPERPLESEDIGEGSPTVGTGCAGWTGWPWYCTGKAGGGKGGGRREGDTDDDWTGGACGRLDTQRGTRTSQHRRSTLRASQSHRSTLSYMVTTRWPQGTVMRSAVRLDSLFGQTRRTHTGAPRRSAHPSPHRTVWDYSDRDRHTRSNVVRGSLFPLAAILQSPHRHTVEERGAAWTVLSSTGRQ